ncbi:hypothetical protein AB0442_25835 [Kitasatospora sp. NPDC085895]|uniref:hypothetical protein n=1 Tax=Kitasatospora sp. NPDC085895 TaxID=3155057 RepID=UPI00344CE68A
MYKEGISEAIALNEREPGEWDTALARLLEQDGRRKPSHCSAPPPTTWFTMTCPTC